MSALRSDANDRIAYGLAADGTEVLRGAAAGGRRRGARRGQPGVVGRPATASATAGFIASTMAVGIRMVAPRSLVVS